MAHLVRCWCGKIHRCEGQKHSPPGWFDREDIHDECPDFCLHGPFQRTIAFFNLSSEKFEQSPSEQKAYEMPLREIILANSVKDPRT